MSIVPPPAELNAAGVIANIESGAYPRDVIHNLARGFLPLQQDDLIAVLAYLCQSEDEEIASLANGSLNDVPGRNILTFAANENAAQEHLTLLVRASRDPYVLEALIRNRNVDDETIVELARRAEGAVQEVVVINHARILRTPEILDALLENPQLTPDVRRRVLEAREEFFDKKARIQQIADDLRDEEIPADLSIDPIIDLLEQAAREAAEKVAAHPTPDLLPHEASDPAKVSVWAQLATMSVADKVQLGFKGNRTVRMILVRERNRLVASAAMRNPRISESEVEAIAGMRNVEEEVLRLIALRRDWMSKYPIAMALCRNPKVPVGIVLPLINRLTLRDLKGLKEDKGVSDVVRQVALRLFKLRQK